ncbi:hypothetical protein ACA910_015447 [Epithemia clementina (nom. ined.)]
MASPEADYTAAPSSGNVGDDDGSEMIPLAHIDHEFQQIGCLGHGAFGSVFLAKKKSGRLVALKFMRLELDGDAEEEHEKFYRELDSVLQLDSSSDCNNGSNGQQRNNRDLSIVFFEDWFTGPSYACIVMNYADGGTLAQEIESKWTQDPYAERRIAWYALQLSSALAHAHERGIAHHDVKSANVLIDRSNGGKLLLADFGSAITRGEEAVGFSELYASPELQAAHALNDYAGLQADKVDAFGLGCILFEMLCCKKLVDLTGEQTLAEFIHEKQSVDAALDLPCLRLPWLPKQPSSVHESTNALNSQIPIVGYSNALRNMVKNLLEPLPCNRWTPSELEDPLQHDSLSPLLAPSVVAAKIPTPGAPVTIDNIQLGMFVQSGKDWDEPDGGAAITGSVGVVIKLDPDGGYTEVAFPPVSDHAVPKSFCCRIGARNKYELQVGPTHFTGSELTMVNGVVLVENPQINLSVGQTINGNFVVVGVDERNRNLFFAAPFDRKVVPTLPIDLPSRPAQLSSVNPRKPIPPPDSWNLEMGVFVEVEDSNERELVTIPFHASQGGLDDQTHQILSIKRVQSIEMWKQYALTREQVAEENWGVVNERRLFHGTRTFPPFPEVVCNMNKYQEMLSQTREFQFSEGSGHGDLSSYRQMSGNEGSIRQLVLSRVALGRIDERSIVQTQAPPYSLKYHSVGKVLLPGSANPVLKLKSYSIHNPFQGFPEYVITYRVIASRPNAVRRRTVRARQPGVVPLREKGRTCDPTTNGGALLRRGLDPSRQNHGLHTNPEPSRLQLLHSRASFSRREYKPSASNDVASQQTRTSFAARNQPLSLSSSSDHTVATDVAVIEGQSIRRQTRSSRQQQTQEHASSSSRARTGSMQQHAASSLDGRRSDRQSSHTFLRQSLSINKVVSSASSSKSSSTSTKLCIICWENPVSRILIPCGHPCLCENCSTVKNLKKLRHKCPECRTIFREAVKFFGKVVED